MPMEESLIAAANGDFILTLLAFLVISLTGGFLWGLKTIANQNQVMNNQIVAEMREIVKAINRNHVAATTSINENHKALIDALKEHDRHAECAAQGIEAIKITINNRPCIRDARR